MSLYSEYVFPTGAAVALPTAGLADVTDASLSVRVEEEEMDLLLCFSGTILQGGAGLLDLQFTVDGTAVTALPVAGHTLLAAGQLALTACFRVSGLSKGEHVVRLQANDAGGASVISSDTHHCVFSAERLSSAATLAHGVGSKVQNSL